MSAKSRIHVGTSGWVYPHWRGLFYPSELPARRWLSFYAGSFDTVEVNNSFYRLPSEATFAGWAREAPPGFVFALKASRFITHLKKLKDPEGPLVNVLGRARALGPRLGPILYQLPPHWRCNADRLRDFLRALPGDLEHVFEFREPSWYNDRVKDLLIEHGSGFCVHDMRGSESPVWVTGPVAYFRFHGPASQAYAGDYPCAELHRWATRIEEVRRSVRTIYAYFNNDVGGHAVRNARQLQAMLGVRPVTVSARA